ncbi:MAG: TauD/TfdA family dioxygenase [Actinomycetota bacterium]
MQQDVPLGRTPDFYAYAEAPLASADLADGVAQVRWPDGTQLDAYALWLFENQMGDVTIEERSREMKFDPADLPGDDVLRSVSIAPNGDLCAQWADGSSSVHHSGWLRHVAERQHQPRSFMPDMVEWTTADLLEPPTHNGPAALVDDDALLEFLHDAVRYGLARLEHLPTDKDALPALGQRIGALRDTNFGVTWPVSVDIKPTSTANTPLPLPPHTDLPTRETPPGFQMLHCLVNTTTGGLSTMADGHAVVRRIREQYPDDYDALCTLDWVFFNRSPQHDHRWTGPLIDHGAPGMPLTIRAFHPVRGFPDMAIEDQPRAYASLRRFSQIAGSDEFQLRYAFRPGDLVLFDNRRTLHGRTAIDETGGVRELHGTYIDHDEIYSRTRVLTRHRTQRERGLA